METGSTNLGNQVVKKIQEKIEISGINNNEFYNTFKSEELDKEEAKTFRGVAARLHFSELRLSRLTVSD